MKVCICLFFLEKHHPCLNGGTTDQILIKSKVSKTPVSDQHCEIPLTCLAASVRNKVRKGKRVSEYFRIDRSFSLFIENVLAVLIPLPLKSYYQKSDNVWKSWNFYSVFLIKYSIHYRRPCHCRKCHNKFCTLLITKNINSHVTNKKKNLEIFVTHEHWHHAFHVSNYSLKNYSDFC